jgi:hypothetical protein
VGSYPEVSLKGARQRRDDARVLIAIKSPDRSASGNELKNGLFLSVEKRKGA